MEELKKRIEKLERRQDAILNITRWDRFPIDIRNEIAEEKREKGETLKQNQDQKTKKQIEREKEMVSTKEKERMREENEIKEGNNQMILDSKADLEDLYKKGKISREEAFCRYVMIGTSYWYKDTYRHLNTSLNEREQINMEKERFEILNRKIIQEGRLKEFDKLTRQERIKELERDEFPI